jgi:DegV family protein with EDD domain
MSSKRIRFVTDSTCDIPTELVEQHGISVAPCFINYGGNSYADDGVELVREHYYETLPDIHPHPTTSAMPPGVAEDSIRAVMDDADHIIIVGVASKLSGVYNTFRLAAGNVLKPEQYTLIDSGNTSMGLGFQVLMGAEAAAAGSDVAQVVDTIHRVRNASRVFCALATMEYLRRSGRVGWAAAGIGALLQIKPVIEVHDGEVHSVARIRTFKRAVDEMVELLNQRAPLDRLAILHANNPDGATELAERLQDIMPPGLLFSSVTPTIGTHIGPGGLGFAYVSKSWRN